MNTDFAAEAKRERLTILALFLASAINGYVCFAISLLALLYCLARSNYVLMLECLVLYVVRTTSMNPVLFAGLPYSGAVRYAVILAYDLCLLMVQYNELPKNTVYNNSILLLALFGCYTAMSSIVFSCYPLVSVMKLSLYLLTLSSVLRTVSANPLYDWRGFLLEILGFMFAASIVTIPFLILRTKNGHSFQGVFQHPNLFGIYGATYLSLVLSEKRYHSIAKLLICVMVMYMVYLSESRTGLFSIGCILLLFYLQFMRNRVDVLVVSTSLLILISIVVYLVYPDFFRELFGALVRFTYKGGKEDILYSRQGQIHRFVERFEANPIFGTGFMTPYEPGKRVFSLDFSLYVEQGNVVMAVLSETGVFGTLLWVIVYGYMFGHGVSSDSYLFFTPFIVSMGEMVFFSANSIGTVLFLVFAIYLFQGKAFVDELPRHNYTLEQHLREQ